MESVIWKAASWREIHTKTSQCPKKEASAKGSRNGAKVQVQENWGGWGLKTEAGACILGNVQETRHVFLRAWWPLACWRDIQWRLLINLAGKMITFSVVNTWNSRYFHLICVDYPRKTAKVTIVFWREFATIIILIFPPPPHLLNTYYIFYEKQFIHYI